jgi:signal transduction histidine kinase
MTTSEDDLRALVHFLDDGVEAERHRLARILHDDMAQGVTALRFGLDRLLDGLVAGAERANLALEARSAIDRLDDLMRAIRRTMTELRPAVLDQLGLRAALEWRLREFERTSGIAAEIDAAVDPPLSGAQATRVYRIVADDLARLERSGTAALVSLALTHGAAGCRIELTAHEYVPGPARPDEPLLMRQLEERARALGDGVGIELRGRARVLTFGVSRAAGEGDA